MHIVALFQNDYLVQYDGHTGEQFDHLWHNRSWYVCCIFSKWLPGTVWIYDVQISDMTTADVYHFICCTFSKWLPGRVWWQDWSTVSASLTWQQLLWPGTCPLSVCARSAWQEWERHSAVSKAPNSGILETLVFGHLQNNKLHSAQTAAGNKPDWPK